MFGKVVPNVMKSKDATSDGKRNVKVVEVRNARFQHSFVASKYVATVQDGAKRTTPAAKRSSILRKRMSSTAGGAVDVALDRVLKWLIVILRPTEICRSLTALKSAQVIDELSLRRKLSLFSEESDSEAANNAEANECAQTTTTSNSSYRYYLAIVSNRGSGVEESALFIIQSPTERNEQTRNDVVRILPIWSDLQIKLRGDGSFRLTSAGESVIIGTGSIHSMWNALATLDKLVLVAIEARLFPYGVSHDWLTAYTAVHKLPGLHKSISRNELAQMAARLQLRRGTDGETLSVSSDSTGSHFRLRRNMSGDSASSDSDLENPPALPRNGDGGSEVAHPEALPSKSELTRVMRDIVSGAEDPDSLTASQVMDGLRAQFGGHIIGEQGYKKALIDELIIRVYGQMEPPSKIANNLYLGTEYNASNKEELVHLGIEYVVNVTCEIENFFPGLFTYHKVSLKDVPSSNLLPHFEDTYQVIKNALNEGSGVLVHCQRGVSRSASVVIAYQMKSQHLSLAKALEFVKKRRRCVKPNKGFLKQLAKYEENLAL